MQVVYLKPHGFQQMREGKVSLSENRILIHKQKIALKEFVFDVPISGTVYGTLLNYKGAYSKIKKEMANPPYNAEPKAPILYIKPINTLTGHNAPIPIPDGFEHLEMGPSLGVVIGRRAYKVKKENVFHYIKGYIVANDVRIPHQSYYRPALKEIARDGFCPVGPWIVDKICVPNPNNLDVKVFINDELKMVNNTKNMVRDISKLIEDVTEFMTLFEGDVLLTGVPENAPFARTGDRVRIEIDQVGILENRITPSNEVWREVK